MLARSVILQVLTHTIGRYIIYIKRVGERIACASVGVVRILSRLVIQNMCVYICVKRDFDRIPPRILASSSDVPFKLRSPRD